jgi:hypothetical protein
MFIQGHWCGESDVFVDVALAGPTSQPPFVPAKKSQPPFVLHFAENLRPPNIFSSAISFLSFHLCFPPSHLSANGERGTLLWSTAGVLPCLPHIRPNDITRSVVELLNGGGATHVGLAVAADDARLGRDSSLTTSTRPLRARSSDAATLFSSATAHVQAGVALLCSAASEL